MGRALALALAALAALAGPAAAQQPLGAWGTTGKAPNQFQRLGGIAADAGGYVYAADHSGGGVLKYTATGEYVRTIGRPRPPKTSAIPRPSTRSGCPRASPSGRTATSTWSK